MCNSDDLKQRLDRLPRFDGDLEEVSHAIGTALGFGNLVWKGEGKTGAVFSTSKPGRMIRITKCPFEAAGVAYLVGLRLDAFKLEAVKPQRFDISGGVVWAYSRCDITAYETDDTDWVERALSTIESGGRPRVGRLSDQDAWVVECIRHQWNSLRRNGVRVRDLLPDNIGFLPDGTPTIRDFGDLEVGWEALETLFALTPITIEQTAPRL